MEGRRAGGREEGRVGQCGSAINNTGVAIRRGCRLDVRRATILLLLYGAHKEAPHRSAN